MLLKHGGISLLISLPTALIRNQKCVQRPLIVQIRLNSVYKLPTLWLTLVNGQNIATGSQLPTMTPGRGDAAFYSNLFYSTSKIGGSFSHRVEVPRSYSNGTFFSSFLNSKFWRKCISITGAFLRHSVFTSFLSGLVSFQVYAPIQLSYYISGLYYSYSYSCS